MAIAVAVNDCQGLDYDLLMAAQQVEAVGEVWFQVWHQQHWPTVRQVHGVDPGAECIYGLSHLRYSGEWYAGTCCCLCLLAHCLVYLNQDLPAAGTYKGLSKCQCVTRQQNGKSNCAVAAPTVGPRELHANRVNQAMRCDSTIATEIATVVANGLHT